MKVTQGTPLPDGEARPQEPDVLLNEEEEVLYRRIGAAITEVDVASDQIIDTGLKEKKAAEANLAQADDDDSRTDAEFKLRQARRKLKVAAGVAGPALAWRVEEMLRDAA